MKRNVVLAAVATLMAGLLVGCGGDDGGAESAGGDYCDQIKSAKEEFDSLDEGDFGQFEKAIDTIHQLADEAPDEVAADWEVMEGAINDLEAALEEAGIEFSDLEGMANGQMPEGLDPAKLQKLGEDLQSMGSEEFQQAADNIEKHAKDECDVDLSSESS